MRGDQLHWDERESPFLEASHSDVNYRPLTTALLAALFGATCSTTPEPKPTEGAAALEPVVEPAPAPPPFVDPPSPTLGRWTVPDYGLDHPRFPYLPGEERHHSLSVGTVTEGFLVNSSPLPRPHPHLHILPRQFERHLLYSSDEMVALLEDAAAHLGEVYPDAVIPLGNFGRQGGGSIPHSVSHNSGRDGDIGFFVLDADGNPTSSPGLLSMDSDGWHIGAEPEDSEESQVILQFDVSRNWRLIEGLLQSNAAELQYIFVSNPLRRMLLEEARRQGASTATIRKASALLVQPGGMARPHDDHFHLRIHCTPRDFAAGCRENGRRGPTFEPDLRLARAAVDQAASLLDDDDPEIRVTAIRRLALLDEHNRLTSRILEHIDDDHPAVRGAAIRAVRDHRPALEPLLTRLEVEEHGAVFAELVAALADRGPDVAPALLTAMAAERPIDLGGAGSLSTTIIIADALARLEYAPAVPTLIDLLAEESPAARPVIAQSLNLLTNHRFASPPTLRDRHQADTEVERWQRWWTDHHDTPRSDWLIAGFQEAGFDVETLGNRDVWELCRAIDEPYFLNFNAQRSLMRISGHSPDSLGWDPYDANFFWRRWFERRQDTLSIPPVPEELSTAGGYTPPD